MSSHDDFLCSPDADLNTDAIKCSISRINDIWRGRGAEVKSRLALIKDIDTDVLECQARQQKVIDTINKWIGEDQTSAGLNGKATETFEDRRRTCEILDVPGHQDYMEPSVSDMMEQTPEQALSLAVERATKEAPDTLVNSAEGTISVSRLSAVPPVSWFLDACPTSG